MLTKEDIQNTIELYYRLHNRYVEHLRHLQNIVYRYEPKDPAFEVGIDIISNTIKRIIDLDKKIIDLDMQLDSLC